jgi:Na+/melibiose symporter-like transporter
VIKRERNTLLDIGERQTFRLHIMYSFIEGIILGVLALNEFVFIKSLKGSSYQLGMLFQFSMVVFLFLIIFNEFMKRVQNKRKMIRITGLITRLPLALLFFFPRNQEIILANPYYHYIFLAIFLLYYMGNPIIYPNINLFLKNSYKHQNFGRLYGYATSLNKIVMLVVTFAYGLLLDMDNYVFVYVFPLVAILGVLSTFILSRIKYITAVITEKKKKFFESVVASARQMYDIIRFNKPYRDFEIGFMFYGFAFMLSVSVVTIFYEVALHLNYSSVAFYKNVYNILAIILLPFMGKLIGKIDPRKFAAISFSSLALYLCFIALTDFFSWNIDFWGIKIYAFLMIAVLFHGGFAATMSLLWSIGSAYFCKKEDAADYQSVHLSLTGVRAMIAPLMGIASYELLGFFITFMFAVLFLLLGVVYMFISHRRFPHLEKQQ